MPDLNQRETQQLLHDIKQSMPAAQPKAPPGDGSYPKTIRMPRNDETVPQRHAYGGRQAGQQPQVEGAQGAVYVDPQQQASQPMAAPDPRANFLPDMNPGTLIPGNPNAPVQAAGAKPQVNNNSTQNHLQIAEIRDGVVIMSDGSFRSVVMVKSINFDLMSPQEREGVEYSYQGFLNSLYFPIQIFVRSERVDIRPYLEKLDKIRSEHDNMLLAMLMDDYLDYVDRLAAQTNIMDKRFYVVIPFFPNNETVKKKNMASATKGLLDGLMSVMNTTKTHILIDEKKLEEAKTELRNRVQAVLGGLMQCGVQGLPLDTQELIELYYDTYNPDTATRQEMRNFEDLQAPIITKGTGDAPQPNLNREMTT